MSAVPTVEDLLVDPESMRIKSGERYVQLVGVLGQTPGPLTPLPIITAVLDVDLVDAEACVPPTPEEKAAVSGTVLCTSCILRPRESSSSAVWVLHLERSDVPIAFKGTSNIINRHCLCPGAPVEVVGSLKRGSAPIGGRRQEIQLAESEVVIHRLGEGHKGTTIKIGFVLSGGAVLGVHNDTELVLVCLHQWCRCQSEVLCPRMVIECFGFTEVSSVAKPISKILVANIHSAVIVKCASDVSPRQNKLEPLYKAVKGLPSAVYEGCPLHTIFECARTVFPAQPLSVVRAPPFDALGVYNLASDLPCHDALGVHVGGPVVVSGRDAADAITEERGVVVRCAKGVCYFQSPDGSLGHIKGDPRPALSVIGKLSDREEKLALCHAASLHPLLHSVEEVSRMPPSSPFTLKAAIVCEVIHRKLSRSPDVLLADVNAEGWDLTIQDVAPTGRLLRVWVSKTQLRRDIPVPSLVDISDAITLDSDYLPERHSSAAFRPVFAVVLPTGFLDLRWPRLPLNMFPHASPTSFWMAGRVSWLREISAHAVCKNCGDKIYLLSACTCGKTRLLSPADAALDGLDVVLTAKGQITSRTSFHVEASFVDQAALSVSTDCSLTTSQLDGVKRYIIADGGGTTILATKETQESKWVSHYLGIKYPQLVTGTYCFRGEHREEGLYIHHARRLGGSRDDVYAKLNKKVFCNLEMID
ncbi:hypothetical protein FOL47_003156 [Perkinsus chesapeaki]|uniref:Uncharacterized protein n=1 Tax=Perkinsus chesapeaki TaxID=330153 RepID=A0A7J6MAF6_PERCH|nr:hypothetical protein FOL47_003156 [Perkinsus chesapeaki]